MSKATRPASRTRKTNPKHRTWEHPKGSGIKIAEMPNMTGGIAYGVSYQVRIPAKLTGGKRDMKAFKTKDEAERFAEDRLVALRKHGTELSKLPADVLKKAGLAWGLIDDANKRLKLNLDFLEVVKAGIRAQGPAGGRKTFADVVAELEASKTNRLNLGGLDSSTHHDFSVRANRIAKKFGPRLMSEIQHTEISDWLAELAKSGAQYGGGLSLRSIRNYRNTLSEIFQHATARRYCSENPLERFTKEDLKNHGGLATDTRAPDINYLELPEARQLLQAAWDSKEEGMLASAVLRLFCGIRTTEVCRLDWSEVRAWTASPHVLIPAAKAKKRRIRTVDIPANALAWLKALNPPKAGPIVPGTGDAKKDSKAYCKRFGRIAEAAGIDAWENNDTRHSFGSYHYALHGDSMKTAALMGHKQNDDVLFTSYRALVTKQDAQAYFDIRPQTADEKVTAFPQAASAS